LAGKRDQDLVLQRLESSVQAAAMDIALLKAAPRNAVPSEPQPMPNPESAAAPKVEAPGGLTRELQHHVSNLTDSDAGVRFQAVSALIESKNPAVRESL